MSLINNRYDFVLLFDVENGNPNGDPDAGNVPRIDPETNYGLITDVCLKRKIRDYVALVKDEEPSFDILVKPDKPLNEKYKEAYEANDIPTGQNDKGKNRVWVGVAKDYMCENYFDVRTFGFVMSTGKDPCGTVRGPVQISFAKSVSPIMPLDVTIIRKAKTTESRQETGETEIGKKSIIPYALYRAEGHIDARLAQKNGYFTEEDLSVLWDAIINMFEHDHSAARGEMRVRGLYVFKHDSSLGNYPSGLLFDKVCVKQKEENMPARSFNDYEVAIDEEMPTGVTLERKI